MRILGIDYGGKRIGLAISDESGILAIGLPTLENRSEEAVLKALADLIADRGVGEIVLGLPRNMDDSLGPQARTVMQFAEKLKPFGLPVHFMDERLTTERARRAMTDAGLSYAKQRRSVDRMAAQFILQMYLDASKRRKAEESQ